MCFGEIIYRTQNVCTAIHERVLLKFNQVKTLELKGLGNFLIDKDDISFLRKYYQKKSELKSELLHKANDLLEQAHSIDWHDGEDLRAIWETNRCQHMFTLAQAYCITQDKKYAETLQSQILDWIEKNPYLTGVNWKSSLEMSLRIISWGWAVQACTLSGFKFENRFMSKLGESVYLQASYITRHFSKYSSANNHLIGEAAGLVGAGCMFDFGKVSKKWVTQGHSILIREIDKQFSKEGLNREQSTAYHCFTSEFYILSYLLLAKGGFEPEFKSTLSKILSATACLVDDNVNYFNIGDSDDAYVLKLSVNSMKETIISILNLSAILFDQPKYDFLPANIDEKTLWMLGSKGQDKHAQIKSVKRDKTSIFLRDSGYFIFNTENTKAIVDIGQLGYLSIAAHAHADTFSFNLNYKNKEFLVDTGTFTYNENESWRNHFRGTSAHNTVVVDKKNQSEIGGNFMWLKKADVSLEAVKSSLVKDYIKASHNGFIKQGSNVKHTREILFNKPDKFFIFDTIEVLDNKEHKIDIYWHFHPECRVEKDNNTVSVCRDGHCINIQLSADTLIYQKVITGCVSRSFNNLEVTKVLKGTCVTNKNIKIVTLIYFS